VLSDADAAYVRRTFLPLAEVAGERADEVATLVAEGRAPAAPYVLDGVPYVPRDHLALLDEAGGAEGLRRLFEERYVVAADTYGAVAGPDELDAAWESYIAGVPQAALVEATPENMVRVERLAAAIERLLDEPEPDSWRWANRLRARVEHLAALTLPGTELDRARNEGPLLRDEHVDEVRERYPGVFASDAPAS
jgi:hypothetical protein